MTTTKTVQEDRLLMAARLLDEDELKVLVNFLQNVIKRKQQKGSEAFGKKDFQSFLEGVRNRAAEKGLTEDILEDILAKDD